jgi:hypothetical protein
MATRSTVETKITAINNAENPAPVPTLESFRISSQAPFFGNDQTSKMFVSIRGIKDEFATMTLMYKSTNPESMSVFFIIPFNQTAGDFTLENFNMLAGQNGNGIIPLFETGNILMYPFPSISNNLGTTANINTNNILYVALVRNFQDWTNSLLIGVRNPGGDTNVATSVTMHAQKFTENLNENMGKVRSSAKTSSKKAATVEDLFGF